jgi:hypothetical protein
MPIETNLNQSPYFDDFNETKNFHRVLFRPGYAVQARELTQLQTILQNQVERFAGEIFVDGSVVEGVGVTLDPRLSYVKLRDKDANTRVLLLGDFYENGAVANAVVEGQTSGVLAQLIDVKEGSEAAAPDYLSIFVKYLNSGANNTTTAFIDNEELVLRDAGTNDFIVAANTISTGATGYGLRASVTDGILYHKGNFVRVAPQSVVVGKYDTQPSKKLGFQTLESIIDSNQDSSLLDNASGATNFSAPGANRLKLTPTLAVRELTDTSNTETFFTIANIEEGQIVKRENSKDSVYSDLGDYISRRIYETNGNYAVEPFNIRIREHLKSPNNLGKYEDGNYLKLVAEVESGVGYVSGNRVEVPASTFREVDKATDYIVKEEAIVGMGIGNYVIADELCGPWNFDQLQSVSLRSAAAGAITDGSYAAKAVAGTEIGTAKVRGIQWHNGTAGAADGQFRVYLTDIQMNSGQSFSSVRGLYIANSIDTGIHSHADIVLDGESAKLKETNLNSLVFPINQGGGTKTLTDAQFVFREGVEFTLGADGAGTITLPTLLTGGNESMNDTGTLSTADKRNIIIVIKDQANNAGYEPGQVLNTTSATINGSTSSSLSVDFDLDLDFEMTCFAYFNVLRSSAKETAKVVNKNKFVKLNTSNNATTSTNSWYLGVPDVYKINAVYKGTSSTTVSTSDIDVTDEFILDDGMKDGFYDISKLQKKVTSTLDVSNCGLLVDISYFTRDYSAGVGFLSVDSYPVDDANPTDADKIATYEIPVYTSPSTGAVYDLRNSIDFRFIKEPGTVDGGGACTPASSAASAPVNPTGSSTFDILTQGAYSPTPDENFQADMQIYLPRKDRLVMTSDGDVVVVKGIPSLAPKTPDEKADSMTIATLDIPPYPSMAPYAARVANRSDYQVRLAVENNRRYTMKDLRAVEDRVKRLEYYSSLNALEASAQSKQLINDSGLTRFKNGFLVDNFDGHNIADINNNAYKVAIDRGNTILRPSYNQDAIPLKLSTTLASSNITQVGDLLMMNYTSVDYIKQPYASKQRNCVQELTFNWTGEIKLDPDSDNISDYTQAPEVQIDFDGIYNSIEQLASRAGVTGIDWGNWRTVAVNSSTSTSSSSSVRDWGSFLRTTTSTTTNTTTQTKQTRTGIQTSVSPSFENFSLGNLVTDVAVRDFMRSRTIRFTGSRMRPNTTVYPFFDGERVDAYCTPADSSFANTGSSSLRTDSEGFVYGYFTIPNDDNLKFRVGTKRFQLLNVTDPVVQADLITTTAHADYTSIGLDVTQQRTGISMKTPQFSTTLITPSDSDPRTTRTTTTFTSRTTTTSRTDWQWRDGEAGDPIAQSFFINATGGSSGVFITSLDLYFAKKPGWGWDSSYTNGPAPLPVTVQIREMVNGVPSKVIVPYGSSTKKASEVNVSADASSATTFTFDSPLYLRNGKEYCFVVIPGGNSQDYVIWTSKLGGTDISTNAIIDKQPSSGVMFLSANDRTWNSIQSEDIKFNLKRANFSTGTGTFYVENDDIDLVTVDNLQSTFRVGEKVYFESELTFANNDSVQVGQILQTHAALNGTTGSNFANGVIREVVTFGSGSVTVKVDNYGIFPTTTASNTNNLYVGTTWIGNTSTFSASAASGFVHFYDRNNRKLYLNRSTGSFANGFIRGQISGAGARITTVDDITMNATVPKLPTISYANNDVKYSIRTTSTGGVIGTSFVDIDNTVETEFIDAEKKVFSRTNESALTAVDGSKKTYVIKGTVTSNTSYTSPIIDTSRINSYVLSNIINNDASDENLNKGNASARYMSKPVVLEDGQDAEDMVVYVTAYKPQNTNVLVYARILNGEDPQSIEEKDFTLLTQVTDSTVYSDPVNRNDFKEFEYTFSANTDGDNFLGSNDDNAAKLDTSDSDVVAYRSSDGSIYHTYKTFAIKIVLTSTSTNVIPLVNDMRAIALQK